MRFFYRIFYRPMVLTDARLMPNGAGRTFRVEVDFVEDLGVAREMLDGGSATGQGQASPLAERGGQ